MSMNCGGTISLGRASSMAVGWIILTMDPMLAIIVNKRDLSQLHVPRLLDEITDHISNEAKGRSSDDLQ
jgi:hypothetical protein